MKRVKLSILKVVVQEFVGVNVHSEVIKACSLLMEDEMIQKGVQIRNSGQKIIS